MLRATPGFFEKAVVLRKVFVCVLVVTFILTQFVKVPGLTNVMVSSLHTFCLPSHLQSCEVGLLEMLLFSSRLIEPVS